MRITLSRKLREREKPLEFNNSASLFIDKKLVVMHEFSETRYYLSKMLKPNDGHILVVGSTNSGKSSCFVIPSLRKWAGRIFYIDVKGELYTYTKDNRPNTKILDLFDKSAYGFNIYELLDASSNPAQEAEAISMAIVPIPPDTKEPFWSQSARNMLTGCILHYHKEGKTFIETIRAILSIPVAQLMDSIYDTTKSIEAKPYLNTFVGLDERPLSGVYAELSRHIMIFATDQDIIRCLSRDKNISPIDLENGNDVCLRIPEHLLKQWSGLLTLLVSQFLRHFEKRPDRTGKPILFMLDEFARLGKIEGITDAFSTLRSKQITLCAIIQSLAQLDKTYGEATRRIIVDNCPYCAVFSVMDVASQQYFSSFMGTKPIWKKGVTLGIPLSASLSYNENREPIIYPEQFAMLKRILLRTPEGVYTIDKFPFFYTDRKAAGM